MYGEDYLDQLFTAVYYTPTGTNALLKSPAHSNGHPSSSHGARKNGGGAKLPRGGSSSNGRVSRNTNSKFVNNINNIRQHGGHEGDARVNRSADRSGGARRPKSAPAKKKKKGNDLGAMYQPKDVPKIAPYDTYVTRRQAGHADLSQTEPARRGSSEYTDPVFARGVFPVLAALHEPSARAAEYEAKIPVSNQPSHFMDNASVADHSYMKAANNSAILHSHADEYRGGEDRPSSVHGVQKYSSRPYDLDKQYTDLNEWISLRQNYVHQINSLEQYEKMCGAQQVISELSMPNFYALMVALRKITIKIADNYRMVILQKETPINLLEVHAYVLSMATDMNCLDRQPFIDWTGLHLSFNPFVSARRLDGASAAAMADLDVMSSQIDHSAPNVIPKDLAMDRYEAAECSDLGAVVWNAYVEDERQKQRQMEQDEAIREQQIQSAVRKAELAAQRDAFEFSGPEALRIRQRKRAWMAWKKAFHLERGINTMASVRGHIITRNVRNIDVFFLLLLYLIFSVPHCRQ
jgi:hypothetical protein